MPRGTQAHEDTLIDTCQGAHRHTNYTRTYLVIHARSLPRALDCSSSFVCDTPRASKASGREVGGGGITGEGDGKRGPGGG